MPSAKELRSEFIELESNWADLRPFLFQYLPHDKQLDKADRLFAVVKRHLERAAQAEEDEWKLLAYWQYARGLTKLREFNSLTDALGERGLLVQEKEMRQRKTKP